MCFRTQSRQTLLAQAQRYYRATCYYWIVTVTPADNSESDQRNAKQLRRENPSAWLKLTDNQTLPLVIDALLDSPPGREFNKKELGTHAGVSRESVRKYIDTLLEFNIVEEVADTEPQRYRLNDEGKATRTLFELQSALNAEGAKEARERQDNAIEGE